MYAHTFVIMLHHGGSMEQNADFLDWVCTYPTLYAKDTSIGNYVAHTIQTTPRKLSKGNGIFATVRIIASGRFEFDLNKLRTQITDDLPVDPQTNKPPHISLRHRLGIVTDEMPEDTLSEGSTV